MLYIIIKTRDGKFQEDMGQNCFKLCMPDFGASSYELINQITYCYY